MALATPTVYIPTLEGGERLAGCLEALARQKADFGVVVADNGPGQGSREMLETRFPHVERISFGGENLGFGTALNRAVKAHGDGPLIFLNDDTVPEPDFLANLIATHRESGSAMVAAVLLKASDPDLIDSAGIACDRTLTAWDFLTGESTLALNGCGDPLGPTGGAALFERRAFEEIGGFDERIFLYYEDLDLALRMRLSGRECRLAAGARAVHESSATLGRRSAEKYRYTGFSRGYLLRKYRIMKHVPSATRVLAGDGSAILAQALLDRTLAGARGRLEGWQAGKMIEGMEPPLEDLEPASLSEQLRVRLRRRRY